MNFTPRGMGPMNFTPRGIEPMNFIHSGTKSMGKKFKLTLLTLVTAIGYRLVQVERTFAFCDLNCVIRTGI